MSKPLKTTATLSVSGKHLMCSQVVATLMRLGIVASVTPNISIEKKKDTISLENWCRIVTTVQNKEELHRIWRTIKEECRLGCGHLKVNGSFAGCTKDYFPVT